MSIIVAFVLCFIGFMHFSMSVGKHFSLIYPKAELSRKLFWFYHGIAWLLLIVAMYLCVQFWQTEIGLTVWVCMLQAASFMVAYCITYQPQTYAIIWKILCFGRLLKPAANS
ncbi:DUF3325 domain-containing protein [Catenovulum sp. 2E275]|uniref:DUF3325 domain-containing protein n=1 Tax=Catenovulum sp. 2E275 TaxID=2980497 RepID=UPI0021CF4588|nr:DUF3325 domain-containing protein [Catenovulum sp. 2E275]MCU4676536.1 DUF3325 domain-containing protein [Catenovulum sp. 2E275]